MELRVSKLMFKNKHFPPDLRLPIKELKSDVHAALHQLNWGRCRLRYALDLATRDRTPLSDRVVDDILHLRDLLETACGTPADAQWVRETLRDAAAKSRTERADSSASDSATTTGQRRREDPSSGRGNAKRATFSGTSDSDSGQHSRRAGRDRLDRRQVPSSIFHAAERNGSDAPPVPPRICRPRETQRLPPRATNSSMENSPGADPPPSLQQMVKAVTAAAIATVDRHLAHMGLNPRSEPAPPQDFVTNARPLMNPGSIAPPPSPAGSVASTTHPAAVPTDNAYPFVNPAPVAPPPSQAGPVASTTHPTAAPTNNACPFVTPAYTATPPSLTGSVAPTTYPAAVPLNNTYPVLAPAPVSAPPPPADSVAPITNHAPAPSRTAPPLRPYSPLPYTAS